MRLLVLGGTEFVGRVLVAEGLARGWDVTVFNRGSKPVPPGVTAIRGDREDPATLDFDGRWDLVADTWSWAPRAVRDSAAALAGKAGHYTYVSSRSVYEYPTPAGAAEDAPVVEADPGAGMTSYDKDKAGGELAATAAFGDRALLVRAGLILGPWENIGRLPWWLARMARGGPVLAPGPADLKLQLIDVRDLAVWTLDAAERGRGGPYNVVSPAGHTTMRELLETCAKVTGGGAELVWTDPEPILAEGVEPWNDLPIWIPPGELYDVMHRADVSKAVADGLRCRPVAETIADTWAWMQEIGGPPAQRPDRQAPGLDTAIEERILNR
jgi:2'-hydroxyisoflavone reductase